MKIIIAFLLVLVSFDGQSKERAFYLEARKGAELIKVEKAIKRVVGPRAKIRKLLNFGQSFLGNRFSIQGEIDSMLPASHLFTDKRYFKEVEEIFEISPLSLTPGRPYRDASDPYSAYQWGLFNNGQTLYQDIDDITSKVIKGVKGADIAWPLPLRGLARKSGRDIIVAVIDSGIDYSHPDLSEAIARNDVECDSKGLPKFGEIDADGNGLPGDCIGWDFTGVKESRKRPDDLLGHGTHVAGIIGAVSNNNIGISGVSNKVKILPLKVFSGEKRSELGGGGKALSDKVSQAIIYAVSRKVDIINLSLGWPRELDAKHLRDAFALAKSKGIILIAAAGNNSSFRPIFPCSYNEVLCIGSHSIDGKVSSFSNFGGHVDLAAPGEEILSTFPRSIVPLRFNAEGYEFKNGTSQAAPFVSAGLAGLMAINPKVSPDVLVAALRQSSKRPANETKLFLGGRVSFKSASSILALERRPLILPNFKELHELTVSPDSKEFKLELVLKNHGQATSSVTEVHAGFSSGLAFSGPRQDLASIAPGGEVRLAFKGKIDRLDRSAIQTLELKIGNKTFKHKIWFGLSGHKEFANVFPINYSGKDKDIAVVFRGKLRSKLLTVSTPFGPHSSPLYYIAKRYKKDESKGLEYFFFFEEKGKFVSRSFKIPHGVSSISVMLADMNGDGEKDFYLRIQAKRPEDEKPVLMHLMYSRDLKPLWKKSSFIFRPKSAILNQESFVLVKHPTHKNVRVPVFLFNGGVPPIDQKENYWKKRPEGKKIPGLYALIPSFSTGEMTDRLILSQEEGEKLGVKWPLNFIILGHRPQTQLEVQRGVGSFWLSIGRSKESYLQELEFIDASRFKKGTKIIAKAPMAGSLNMKLFKGQSLSPSDRVRIKLVRPDIAQFWWRDLSGKEFIQYFENDNPRDHILSVLNAQLDDQNRLHAFTQSKNRLSYTLFEEGKAPKNSYFPLNRVSFITNDVFSGLYYPLVNKGRLGLYVDVTFFHSRHVYFVGPKAGRIVSHIHENRFIPKGCFPQNPVHFKKEAHLAFLCLDDKSKSLEMRFFKL